MLNNDKTVNRTLFVIGVFLITYTALRAYFMSITFDESATYINYVRKGFIGFKDYNIHGTNNHLLNTWLMELFIKIFGLHIFTLRLPNVLFHALYLIYSAKLVRNLSSKMMVVGAFLIINLNPFLLDFFSIARGCGISMGLMMASLYYAYKFIEGKGTYISAFISIVLATLAVFAHFILLNYLLILSTFLVLINLLNVIKDNTLSLKLKGPVLLWNSIIIGFPLVTLFYIIPTMLHLKENDLTYFGVSGSFWHNVVDKLNMQMLSDFPFLDFMTVIFSVFTGLVLIASFSMIIESLITKKSILKDSFMSFIFYVILLCFVANYLQKELMNILYPTGRYALNYFPMFSLLLIFLFERLYTNFGILFKRIFAGIALFFVVNFLTAVNFKHTHDWDSEADTKDMIEYLKLSKKQIPPEKFNLNIGVSFQLYTDIDFYKCFYHLDWLNATCIESAWYPLNDYFYIERKDTTFLSHIKYKILKEYPITNTLLISNEEQWKTKELYHDKNNFDNLERNNSHPSITMQNSYSGKYSSKLTEKWAYSPGLDYVIDDTLIKYKNVSITIKAMVYTSSIHSDAILIFSIQDGQQIKNYFNVNIEDFVRKPNEWTPVYFTVLLPKDAKKGERILSYFWNICQHDVYIDDLEYKIVAYEKLNLLK